MKIARLILDKFKKISNAEVRLDAINVLIGGNNSGKSSFLQGVHFCSGAAMVARQVGQQTFAQDALPYVPARDFSYLRHGVAYSNQTHSGSLEIFAKSLPDEPELGYKVRIYRGRNEGNVGCERSGDAKLGALVADHESAFTIYVPGLAGIPTVEQLRSESVVRKGVASGDSNLYLRNVIYLIEQSGKLPDLMARMKEVFPTFDIVVEFDPRRDLYINVKVSNHGELRPLEQAGTGVLQALQIFSYVTLFRPRLLLLDEPDSHLHPDNQITLARALIATGDTTDTQVLLATHSRHLVDFLADAANFAWLRDGAVYQQGDSVDRISLLMELGALNLYDKLQNGQIDALVLTEDADPKGLTTLLQANGFPAARTLVFPYRSSSRLDGALIAAEFVRKVAPNTTIVVHRDRDFMTDEEVATVTSKIEAVGAKPFITEGSDIESYFVRAAYLALLTGRAVQEIAQVLDVIATQNHNELVHKFGRKRDEVKIALYKAGNAQPPDTLALLGANVPLPEDRRLGKIMLGKVRGSNEFAEVAAHAIQPLAPLHSADLTAMAQEIFAA